MQEMIGYLKQIIYKNAILNNFIDSDNSFYIKEDDKLAKCKRINLKGFKKESLFAFRLDVKNIKKISNYLSNKEGFDKGNDAIIFNQLDSQNYIFICELKDSGKGYLTQFKSSISFVEYILSILKNFYGINVALKDFNIVYIVFANKDEMRTTKGKIIPTRQDGFEIYKLDCRKKNFYVQSLLKG